MHQTRVRIHANVGIHAEIPLIALLTLVHLGVALTPLHATHPTSLTKIRLQSTQYLHSTCLKSTTNLS